MEIPASTLQKMASNTEKTAAPNLLPFPTPLPDDCPLCGKG